MDNQDALAKSQIFTVRLGSLTPMTDSSLASDQAKLPIGTVVDQKYEILALIGEGGMGAVYRARHALLNKEVALKTFSSHVQSEEAQQRFQREAQALAKLRHRNVVEIFDYGLQKDKTPFYTMEYLIGKSLAEKIAGGKILSVEQALPLFIQAASGLAYVHSKGLVHRDLKPGNIFVEKNGNVKIVDFGIVSTTAEQDEDQRLTRTSDGIIMGSPLYMSPEQASGKATGPASDVYSFGCALYECLTGRPPFVGANALITIMMHQDLKAPSLAEASGGDYSPQLELVVARLLAKKPEARFRDFGAVESSLKRCLQPDPLFADALSSDKENYEDRENYEDNASSNDQSNHKLKYAGLGAAITALLIIASGLFAWRHQAQMEKSAPEARHVESLAISQKTGDIIGPLATIVEPPSETQPLPKFSVKNVKGPRGENLVNVIFPTAIKVGYYRFQPNDEKSLLARGSCFWPSQSNLIFTPDINFAKNPLNFEMLAALNLHGLDLRHVDPMSINNQVLSRISKLQGLTQLWMPKLSLSAADLKYFDKMPALNLLSIELSGISGSELARWPNLSRIQGLNVSGTREPSSILKRLKSDNKINALYMERIPLTEEDYRQLASIKSLQTLVMANSNLDNSNLKILADKSPGLKALSSRQCTVSPTMLPALIKMQKNGLEILELYSTRFTPADCDRIQRTLSGVKCSLSPLEEDFTEDAVKTFTRHAL